MKKLFVAGVAATAFFGASAFAADMPAKAPPMASMFNWTGFYIGGQGGYGSGNSAHFVPGSNSTGDFNLDGAVGGGTIGYNWQWQHWVVGVEADDAWSNIKGSTHGSANFGCAGATAFCTTNVNSLGTARGRIGYAADRWLAYVTGGFAFGAITAAIPAAAVSGSKTQDGWTVGGGVEYGIDRNWSAKIEYLYVDLGHFTYATLVIIPLDTKAQFNVVRAGINYRFGTQ